jgi:protease IV
MIEKVFMTSDQSSLLGRLKSSCLFFVLLALCFVIGLSVVTAALSQLGEEKSGIIEQSSGDNDPNSSAVAVISLSGVMLRSADGVNEGITQDLLRMLDKAKDDSRIKGVLIRLNTPGGSVTDADLVYHEIKSLKDSGKPVLLLMDDTCASGGYYAALAASEVWALPTTITGSIGVIVSGLNFSKFLSNHGVSDESITSGPNKALFSATSPPNAAHREILQEIVNQLYARFLDLLVKGRSLDVTEAKRLADGRVYTAADALKNKLIDQIGYPQQALDRIKKLSGLSEGTRVVKYHVPKSFFSRFSGSLGLSTEQLFNDQTMAKLALEGPKAYYMYAPQGMMWRALRLLNTP